MRKEEASGLGLGESEGREKIKIPILVFTVDRIAY
jgi:hypothetical protein